MLHVGLEVEIHVNDPSRGLDIKEVWGEIARWSLVVAGLGQYGLPV